MRPPLTPAWLALALWLLALAAPARTIDVVPSLGDETPSVVTEVDASRFFFGQASRGLVLDQAAFGAGLFADAVPGEALPGAQDAPADLFDFRGEPAGASGSNASGDGLFADVRALAALGLGVALAVGLRLAAALA